MNLVELTRTIGEALEEHYRLLQELGGWPETESPAAPEQVPAPEPDEQLLGAQELEYELHFLARQLGHQLGRLAELRPHLDEVGQAELEVVMDRIWSVSAQLFLLDLGRYVPIQVEE